MESHIDYELHLFEAIGNLTGCQAANQQQQVIKYKRE